MGPAAFRRLPKGGFLYARLVPISPVPGAWLVSGHIRAFPKSAGAQIAQVALQLATTQPELVFRNPEKIEQGWKQVRDDRAAFIEFFGGDELVLSPAEADTIGLICDEIDGLNFYNDYGMLRELFADQALAADKRYSDVLRGYLGAETVGPLPIRRLALAHPETADAVFRKVLRKPSFTWADHGQALLYRRKAWYYEHEPRPGISVIGARLKELTDLR
jgi:hypothetical protein